MAKFYQQHNLVNNSLADNNNNNFVPVKQKKLT